MAKSMLDSRIIDLHFNKIFLKLVLGEQIALTLDNLKVLLISRSHPTLLTIPSSSSILTLRHLWRSYKGCPKNPAAERLVDVRSRHVSLY